MCYLVLSVSNPSYRRGFLLSLDNLFRSQHPSHVFVLRNASLLSTWLLQRSVTVCCPFCCSCVKPFHTSSVLCCCSSSDFLTVFTWFSQLGCFLLLLNFNLCSNLTRCSPAFSVTLFCCHASMTFSIFVSRHGSNFLRDIVFFVRLGLLLALLFLSAVGCALLPLCSALVDLLLVVALVLRASFVHFWL